MNGVIEQVFEDVQHSEKNLLRVLLTMIGLVMKCGTICLQRTDYLAVEIKGKYPDSVCTQFNCDDTFHFDKVIFCLNGFS